jgi:Helix-turn-helix domain
MRYPRKSTSEENRARIWDRWEQGMNMAEISRALGIRPIRVRSVIDWHGGIRPASRRRSVRNFSAAEREMISRGLVAGCSMREVARHLQRAASGSGPLRGHQGLPSLQCRSTGLVASQTSEGMFTSAPRGIT